MRMIVMTTEQAATVRGPTGPHRALDPIMLADGVTYVLPVRLLADYPSLNALPQRDIAPSKFRQVEDG